ncbi:MAG: VWA domain-containing protein [Elusimicrobia bacterium]|nr:VWA domain-containing protein [Elusimicrobiota bacterium]
MTFAHPHILWLLVLLPAAAYYDFRWGFLARAKVSFSSLALLGRATTKRPVDHALRSALRLTALGLLIFALARPQEGQQRREVTSPATDIVLALDISDSMRSLDFKPRNRFQAALEVIRLFIKDRPDDRLALVLFAKYAFTQCPLTLDHGALLGFLDNVQIGLIEQDRTAIGSAIATSVSRLKGSEAATKLIVLLTDGRSNFGDVDPITAAKAAAAFGIKIYTVGAGAPGGGMMEVDDPMFGKRMVKMPENELDETTLREVAQRTGGTYFRATDFESLKRIYKEIDQMEKTEVKVETYADYKDRHLPFLLVAFFLIGLESLLAVTLWRRVP